jgi:nitrite reductase/ring-hydroxylating ferredoxin subunit
MLELMYRISEFCAMKKVCELNDIPENQACSFPYNEHYSLLVYRQDNKTYGYINSCPHAGVPLEWSRNHFMSKDGLSLQCGTHGAQFDPTSGHCFSGPCKGAHLHKVDIVLKKGVVYLV